MYSRRGQRRGVLLVIVALFVAIVGVALANAFSPNTTTLSGAQVSQSPTPAADEKSASASPKATKPAPKPTASQTTEPTHSASPAATTSPQVHHTAAPVATHHSTPRPKPTKTAGCPPASTRLSQARATLLHPSALPQASVITAGPQSGTLGTADLAGHTITLYMRSCSEEPISKLAVVWMYEAGQFVDVETWDAAKRDQWRQLRGGAALASTQELRQDAAAVYSYYQLGSTATSSWQSPVPPPSPSQLSRLVPYLHLS